ncbi:SRPBCC family protein [Nannocystaceae bacterium ST9]
MNTTVTTVTTDRIEKHILLRASSSRVWRALTDAAEFGAWFRVKLEGPFVEGGQLRGQFTIPGYEHVTMAVQVERIEPQRYFAYRWHPYAVHPEVDYSREPTTLVEFRLSEVAGGTELEVVESGFDRLPPARRAEALRMNEAGWVAQLDNIARHVTQS